jgi:hypothetical protein
MYILVGYREEQPETDHFLLNEIVVIESLELAVQNQKSNDTP